MPMAVLSNQERPYKGYLGMARNTQTIQSCNGPFSPVVLPLLQEVTWKSKRCARCLIVLRLWLHYLLKRSSLQWVKFQHTSS